MVVLAGGKLYPWQGAATPTSAPSEGQYPALLTVAPSGSTNSASSNITFPKMYNRSLAVYTQLSTDVDGVSDLSNTLWFGSTIFAPFLSQSNFVGISAATAAKNDTGKILTHAANAGAGSNWTLLALMYKASAFALHTVTNDGDKFISGGGNPVTDWAGAAAHGTEANSCVRKLTLTGSPTGTYMLITNKWTIGGSSGLSGTYYLWNFQSSAWDTMTFVRGGGGNPTSGYGYAVVAYANYVSSNVIYARFQSTGSSPTTTAKDASTPIIFGEASPVD